LIGPLGTVLILLRIRRLGVRIPPSAPHLRAIALRQHVERAFEQAKVSIDFAALSGKATELADAGAHAVTSRLAEVSKALRATPPAALPS
jgi:hypothetical protein